MVVTELTQSLTKVMAENYKRANTSPLVAPDHSQESRSAEKPAFKSKKESMPLKTNPESLF